MPLCDFKCEFLSFSHLFNDLARQRDPYSAHIAFDCVPITIGHLHSANLAEIQSEEYAAAVQRLCGGDGGTCRLIGKLEILVDRMCTNIGDFGRVRGSKQRSQPSLTGSLRKHSAHSGGSLCIIQPEKRQNHRRRSYGGYGVAKSKKPIEYEQYAIVKLFYLTIEFFWHKCNNIRHSPKKGVEAKWHCATRNCGNY